MKRLNELLPLSNNVTIESIYSDSRKVTKNSIFFCLDGLTTDGHQYIDEAICNGAICIVHSRQINQKKDNIIYYFYDDVLSLLNDVACKFYDYPSKQLRMIGITGTNGKTIVSSLIYQGLNQVLPFGYIGSQYIKIEDNVVSQLYTTPEVIFLQQSLKNMVDHKIKGACLEVSSHGLTLGRIKGIEFEIAVFTNICPDHLDFHGSYEEYKEAKLKLFQNLSSNSKAIVNIDESMMYQQIVKVTKANVLSYGIYHDADLQAFDIELGLKNTKFKIKYMNQTYLVVSKLLGEFNVYHILATMLVWLQFNIEIEKCIDFIEKIDYVKGRLEPVLNHYHLNIFIDNGSTPEHYQQILSFSKALKHQGRVILVFGCEGKKDLKKRIEIGKIADSYCDHIILTEEDSRDEDTEKICEDIKKGITKATCVTVVDRETAILQAIETTTPNDLIFIMGKGESKSIHRKYGIEEYIGDYQAAKNAIYEIYGEEYDIND